MSKKWPFPNNSNNQQNELVIDYFMDNNNQNHVQPYPQPVADFPIGTFSVDDEFTGMKVGGNGVVNGSNSNSNSTYDANNQGAKETGIIEKLLHSYGFIQCCERQARLFFHFSQFSGNLEHLKIGDPVEFEMTYDRRTGKPIASFVSKISPEAVLREERVTGSVTTENITASPNVDGLPGRISYENRGECFFLPFTKDEVEGNVNLVVGDKVSFQISTNNKGNLEARNIRLEDSNHPIKYRGVVCSVKDNFGFIERADVVKEIFFHFSESQNGICPGDHVEFIIQTRGNKEVASNVEKLPPCSVILEDISTEIMKGQVLKPIDRKELPNLLPNGITIPNTDNFMGRIRYRAIDHSEMEITFGHKDQVGDFTLKHGDWVQFKITTDRRDQLKRATMIELMPDCSFNVSGEKRERGVVDKICDGFGFLRCTDRDNRVFFHFNELLEPNYGDPIIGDEFEFTIITDSSSKQQKFNAIRLMKLEPGTVQFEITLRSKINGIITKDIFHNTFFSDDDFGDLLNSSKNTHALNFFDQINLYSGLITYVDENGVKNSITYYLKDCNSANTLPNLGDKVEFNISQVKATKEIIATNVHVLEVFTDVQAPNNGSNLVPGGDSNYIQVENVPNNVNYTGRATSQIGFIAQIFKENFGFIETFDQKDEVFFHYSVFEGDITKIKSGEAVEFILSDNKKNMVNDRGFSAACVRLVKSESIQMPEILSKNYKGVVRRALRHFNSDQNEYSGLVEVLNGSPSNNEHEIEDVLVPSVDKGTGVQYHYGLMSLTNKMDIIQVGDHVSFQLDSENRICNLVQLKKWLKSKVDAVKGEFGFITYEVSEGRKLFFHMSEVKDGAELNVGDIVKFYIVKSHKTGKCSAHNIIKLENKKERPERLLNRLRAISVSESGPKLTIVRQPKGPDNSKGFSRNFRSQHKPGEMSV